MIQPVRMAITCKGQLSCRKFFKLRVTPVLAVLVMLLPGIEAFGLEASRVLLVVNADSWASTYVANEYAALRGIPPGNIVLLSGLATFDPMPVETFRREILGPVLAAMEQRGLQDQVDTVVYSADFPPAIDVSGDLQNKELPAIFAPQCSINGLTFFAADVMARRTTYLDLKVNAYACKFPHIARDTPWSDAERHSLALALKILQKPSPGDTAADQLPEIRMQVNAILEELRKSHPGSDILLYNIACSNAKLGDADAAMVALRQAIEAGWMDAVTTATDDDLKSLRERADFKTMIAELKLRAIDIAPSAPFVRTLTGSNYWLSTMLACTSGRGNSVKEAISCLRSAASADASSPAGIVFYMRNGDVRSSTREWAFASACDRLNAIGVRAEIREGVLPQKQSAVAGAMIGIADFSWKDCGSKLLPGAIAEHLTSCGGMMSEFDGQTPLSEFIRNGAAGASGTVAEPYALQGKFPNPFIQWFYAQGCTLAEAFYQSVTGPYQLLIVGDPLCRPWARRAAVEVTRPAAGSTVNGKCRLAVKIGEEMDKAAGTLDVLLDGRRVAMLTNGVRRLTIDTRGYDDGWHELTVAVSPQNIKPLCGSVSQALWFANKDKSRLEVLPASFADMAWDQQLTVKAAFAGAETIFLEHLGRVVGRLQGERGAMTVHLQRVGQGPSVLLPVAVVRGRGGVMRAIRGEPVRVNVVPPAPLAAVDLPAGKTLSDGLLLTVGGKSPQVLARLDRQPFGAGVAGAGTNEFVLEGWVCADVTAVHQFQVTGSAMIRALKVDSNDCDWPRGSGPWWFIPVNLQKGWHKVVIEGSAETGATLDIRFGGTGTQRLAGSRFKHFAL